MLHLQLQVWAASSIDGHHSTQNQLTWELGISDGTFPSKRAKSKKKKKKNAALLKPKHLFGPMCCSHRTNLGVVLVSSNTAGRDGRGTNQGSHENASQRGGGCHEHLKTTQRGASSGASSGNVDVSEMNLSAFPKELKKHMAERSES